MIREDIKVEVISPLLVDIKTENNEFSINTHDLYFATNAKIKMSALDDIEKSKIVEITRYQVSESGRVIIEMKRKFGFSIEKFVNVMIFIIEKYKL